MEGITLLPTSDTLTFISISRNFVFLFFDRAEAYAVHTQSFKGKQLWRRVQSFTEEMQESVRQKNE